MRACRHGTFVDLGCYDGVTYSNTWYFERKLGWSGVCVEPEPALPLQTLPACSPSPNPTPNPSPNPSPYPKPNPSPTPNQNPAVFPRIASQAGRASGVLAAVSDHEGTAQFVAAFMRSSLNESAVDWGTLNPNPKPNPNPGPDAHP